MIGSLALQSTFCIPSFASFEITAPKDGKKLDSVKAQIKGAGGLEAWEGIQVSECAREITISVFATDESASVQVRPARTSAARVGGTDPEQIKKTGDTVQDGGTIN